MRIAFLSAVFPYPLHSGGQIRIFQLCKRLSKKHEISLFTYLRAPSDEMHRPSISFFQDVYTFHRGHAWQMKYLVQSVRKNTPFLWSTYQNEHMKRFLGLKLKDHAFDCIHIEPGYIADILPDSIDCPLVVCEHNIEHQVYEGYSSRFPYPLIRSLFQYDIEKMKKKEREVWNRAQSVVAVSDHDKDWILHEAPHTQVCVVQNGVDLSYYQLSDTLSRGGSMPKKMVFLGNYSWIQNTDAVWNLVSSVWKIIRSACPDATLTLAGSGLPAHIRSYIAHDKSIQYVGVIGDVRSLYHSHDVLVAPIRSGGGTKYKILEAMACGLPVMTTPEGALGLDVLSEKHLFICKNDDDWKQGCIALSSSKKRRELIQNARTLVEAQYSWDQCAERLNTVWNNVR